MKNNIKFCFGKVANCKSLDLRSNPSINSKVICTLFPGTEVIIEDDPVSLKTDWIKICTVSGVEGYAKDFYVSEVKTNER